MSDLGGPVIRVRAVRGRVVDPFRGHVDDGAQRLASRATESQPFDDVMAALGAIGGVTMERAGRRFTLKRGSDALKVSFASAGKRVSLDDLALEGDGALAIVVMHALMPFFGAVEIEVGRFADLIDGHEPLDAVMKRYDTWFIEDSLRVAKRLEARDAAAQVAASKPPPAPRPRRVSNGWVAVGALGLLALFVGLTVASQTRALHTYSYSSINEHCTQNTQCETSYCLPREPVQSVNVGGIDTALLTHPTPPSDPSGVCTKACAVDSDCPSTMLCGDVISYGSLGIGSRARACIPRAWQ